MDMETIEKIIRLIAEFKVTMETPEKFWGKKNIIYKRKEKIKTDSFELQYERYWLTKELAYNHQTITKENENEPIKIIDFIERVGTTNICSIYSSDDEIRKFLEKEIPYDNIKEWLSHNYLSADEIHKLGILNNKNEYLIYDDISVLEE